MKNFRALRILRVILFAVVFIFLRIKPVHAALINASGIFGEVDSNGTAIYTRGDANNASSTPNAQGFNDPSSDAIDTLNHRLFVSDINNRRILVFSLDSSNNIATTTASYVLGPCDFSTVGSSFGGNVINLAYDPVNSRVFLSDFSGGDILAFDASPSTIFNCEPPLFQLSGNPAQGAFSGPDDITYDSINNRLFVSDQNHGRVMAFSVPGNATSSIDGENALFELGQTDFNGSSPSNGQSGINAPDDNEYDAVNNRFFVSDTGNDRIMVFYIPGNATSSINGENAQANIGWSNFTTPSRGTSQNQYSVVESPHGYDSLNNRFFLYDYPNNRVMEIPMIRITTASVSTGTLYSSYNQTINITQAQGASQGYQIISGALPPGLNIASSTGVISGTPTIATTTSVTIEADDTFSDSSVFFDRATYNFIIISTSSPPQSVSAISGDNQATVNFTAPASNGGSNIIYYTVTSNPDDISVTSTSTSILVPGLTNGTPYTFTVTATNGVGTSNPSYTSSSVTPVAPVFAGGGSSGGYGYVYTPPATITPTTTPPATSPTTTPTNTVTIPTTNPLVSPQPSFSPSSAASESVKLINDQGTFYLVQNSQRFGITNPGILSSYGLSFSDASVPTPADLSSPVVSNLSPYNGALVKGLNDPTVYLISIGQRYGFTSASVFGALGFKFSSVLTVTAPELSALPLATNPIKDSTAAHNQGVDINDHGTVYWIGADVQKHPYPSLAVYNSWHIDGDFSGVVPANAADLVLPTGASVVARVIN